MRRRPQIALGCVTFGREIDEESSFALLDHALERGVRHFDTAAAYGSGASETILGKWLSSRKPTGITIATKVLPPYDGIDITPSLKRLGVDQLDLLYLHQWHDTAPLAASNLEGLPTKKLGVSNFTLEQLRAVGPQFGVVQNNHNLAVSDVNADLRAYCEAGGISIITYSPLGAGFLTGKHQHGVHPGSRFDIIPGHQNVYFHEQAWKRLAMLEALAERTGIPQPKLALAWAMHQPGIDSVLIGGRSSAHLEQAIDALELDDPDLLAELDAVASFTIA